VGKTSIIDRFIRDEFDFSNNVKEQTYSPQLELIFYLEILQLIIVLIDYNFGIQLGNKNIKV